MKERSSNPFSFLILSLFFLFPMGLIAAPPGEATGFATGGLRLFPLGWSSEGRWGALIWRDDQAGGPAFQAVVIDSVTDEELFRSDLIPLDSPDRLNDLWESNTSFFTSLLNTYGLEAPAAPDVREPSFITEGTRYALSSDPPSPAEGPYTLRISSNRGDAKIIYRSPESSPPARSEVLGAVLSPYGSRVLAILSEEPGNGAPTRYRFSGAHLTLGFVARTVPDQGLVSAVMNGQEYLVRSRLAAGASPDARDARGYSVVLLAARLGHWTILSDLLSGGASPNGSDAQGRTALHHAVLQGFGPGVRRLVDAGADTAAVDVHGKTAADLTADPNIRGMLR